MSSSIVSDVIPSQKDLVGLYDAVGWTAYTRAAPYSIIGLISGFS